MSGTVAIWFERLAETANAPPACLVAHVNLWRHVKRDKSNITFLDIGFQFEQLESLKKIFLYLPIDLEPGEIVDLGPKLENATTLAAVFNDVLTTRHTPDDQSFVAVDANGADKFTCHYVNLQDDIEIRRDNFGGIKPGTLITFKEDFANRIRLERRPYIRLRFLLNQNSFREFTSETIPEDKFLLSSFLRTELIEFRFNEKRNYPPHIVEYFKLAGATEFIITEVNYFLIRDLRFEYVSSHAEYRKMRRLEGPQWEAYVDGSFDTADADRMLIYQWKKVLPEDALDGSSVEDFIALAKFKLPWPNVWPYVIAIVFLGAAGSTVSSLASSVSKAAYCTTDLCANFAALLLLLILIGLGLLFGRK